MHIYFDAIAGISAFGDQLGKFWKSFVGLRLVVNPRFLQLQYSLADQVSQIHIYLDAISMIIELSILNQVILEIIGRVEIGYLS